MFFNADLYFGNIIAPYERFWEHWVKSGISFLSPQETSITDLYYKNGSLKHSNIADIEEDKAFEILLSALNKLENFSTFNFIHRKIPNTNK